jgi:hypothetical protein
LLVAGLPSLHGVPAGDFSTEQFEPLQTELDSQTPGLQPYEVPMQPPEALHTSFFVHAIPSSQALPDTGA